MIKFHDLNGLTIAEVTDAAFVITSAQDAVDLLGEMYFKNCSRIILMESNLHPDFFRLHTGLAGDILQKFSNYNCILSIIGDFSKYKSKNLKDFVRESNNGRRIFFVNTINDALNRMIKE